MCDCDGGFLPPHKSIEKDFPANGQATEEQKKGKKFYETFFAGQRNVPQPPETHNKQGKRQTSIKIKISSPLHTAQEGAGGKKKISKNFLKTIFSPF